MKEGRNSSVSCRVERPLWIKPCRLPEDSSKTALAAERSPTTGVERRTQVEVDLITSQRALMSLISDD